MSKASAPDWAAVRRDYERNSEALPALCARHGVSMSALNRRARGEGWLRRAGRRRLARTSAGRRSVLVNRLCNILEEEVRRIEDGLTRRAADADAKAAEDDERRLRALGSVMRTLDKLIQLEEQTRRDAPGEGKPQQENFTEADAERLRHELSERFARLRSGDGHGVS